MIIQFVKFESALPEPEVLNVAQSRLDQFRALPGLLQKYYVKLNTENGYGGIYIWDSIDSLKAFRESELAASIPAAYNVIGQPDIEIFESFEQLRDL